MNEDAEIVSEFLVESHENLDQLDRDLVELEQRPGSRDLLSSIFRTIHTIKGTCGFLAFHNLEAVAHAGENLLSRLRDGEMTMTEGTAEVLLHLVDCVRDLLVVVEQTGSDVSDGVDVERVVAAVRQALGGQVEPTPATLPAPDVQPAPDVHPGEDAAPDDEPADAPRRGIADASVRVDVELLDSLVQLVGELVLTRNQIVQQADSVDDLELSRASQRLDLVASELQENVMRTRMQPIGHVWAKLPRIVRDLSHQLGRKVVLDMTGHDTELDRSLLEALRDPLVHLVRNAMDHGFETPAERVRAGKPETGRLSVRAYHESGQVIVEISDDGQGIDPVVIGEAAVRRGVLSADTLARMDPREIVQLVFRPGFSTADEVTNLSGRGVGMDVVRTNIERIGGSVDLSSRPGSGTTCRVRIPLTLAIIPALVVGENGERYAIPQVNLVELVRLEGEELTRNVEVLAGSPVLRLRGRLLPLLHLADALGFARADAGTLTVIVLQADEVRFALAVEEVHDTQEIVVKPIGRQLKTLPMYAGATIMGDGRVALILDVLGLAQAHGIDAAMVREAEAPAVAAEQTALLVLEVASGRRAALPLTDVSRLEEFTMDRVERTGGHEVVQYRDGILPLVRLADAIGLVETPDAREELSVVVHDDGGHRVGIVIDRVLDIVDTTLVTSAVGRRAGVLGSAVVQDRVTDLIDLDAVVALANAGAA